MKNFSTQLRSEIYPQLKEELNLKSIMAVPAVEKIIVNVGIGTRMKTTKDYSDIVDNIARITGQQPIVTKAKKAISNFKLRQGMPTGVTVTLRKKSAENFLYKMIHVAFPRIRDFQGFSRKAFDGNGNYSIGIKDCSVFPEVNPENISYNHGMSITIVTSCESDDHALKLLETIKFPFKKQPQTS